MFYKIFISFTLFTIVNTFFNSCTKKEALNIAGIWRATVETDGGKLPFHLQILPKSDSVSYEAYVINGEEKLKIDDLVMEGDSVQIPIEIFDAKIVAKLDNNKLIGRWQRYVGGAKYIHTAFEAERGVAERFFSQNTDNQSDVSGKWATNFASKDGQNKTEAVGIFEQKGKTVTGTFLTTTGDYRYLEGIMDGDSLKLSTFDGTHLFLFKAKKLGNRMKGQFWSNIHSLENWTATLDSTAKLPDLNTLTYLKPGYAKIEFAFPDLTGKTVSINDKPFENKVKIIQLMGTWCPNCMDESKYLAPWYDKNKNRGVEIIGLAFEKSTDLAIAGPKLEKMKQRFGINYTILLAGLKAEGETDKSLPMINKVLGFPTTIIIDKKGNVRQIHTGFSGPGTGHYYEEWIEDFNLLMDKLLAEK
jgi:thiol-disulfide isomerase/thioredoxin